MILLGAKRHAKEIIDVLEVNEFKSEVFLFDDVLENSTEIVYNKYKVLKSIQQVALSHQQKHHMFME